MGLEAEELKAVGEAVKEVLDDRLEPLEERLTKLEATKSDPPAGDGEGEEEEAATDEANKEGKSEEKAGAEGKSELSDEQKTAIQEAVDAAMEPVSSELNELKTGIDQMVGASKSIVDEDDDNGDGDDGKSATKSHPRRDAWGRRVHTRS